MNSIELDMLQTAGVGALGSLPLSGAGPFCRQRSLSSRASVSSAT